MFNNYSDDSLGLFENKRLRCLFIVLCGYYILVINIITTELHYGQFSLGTHQLKLPIVTWLAVRLFSVALYSVVELRPSSATMIPEMTAGSQPP